MKTALLVFAVSLICSQAHALELSKTTEHDHGWAFNFTTVINGKKYPIEIPYGKCTPSTPTKGCYATKGEAMHQAWVQAKKADVLMKQALSK